MVDVRFRQAVELATTDAQPPAKVYLLIMRKEAPVQTSTVPIVLGANHQCGTCSPQDLRRIVVLSIVSLHRIKDASTAERIAITVKVSPTRPRILEHILIKYREQLGLTCGHLGMHIHKLNQRRQPMVRDLDIRVQQQIVFGLNLRQCLVVTLGKAPILFQQNQFALRKLTTQQVERIVCRRIVSHIDRRLVARVIKHRGQILFKHLSPVPVQYNDCYLIHLPLSTINYQLAKREVPFGRGSYHPNGHEKVGCHIPLSHRQATAPRGCSFS